MDNLYLHNRNVSLVLFQHNLTCGVGKNMAAIPWCLDRLFSRKSFAIPCSHRESFPHFPDDFHDNSRLICNLQLKLVTLCWPLISILLFCGCYEQISWYMSGTSNASSFSNLGHIVATQIHFNSVDLRVSIKSRDLLKSPLLNHLFECACFDIPRIIVLLRSDCSIIICSECVETKHTFRLWFSKSFAFCALSRYIPVVFGIAVCNNRTFRQ